MTAVAERLDAIGYREDVLTMLRQEAARIHAETGRPVSANDVRPLLNSIGYRGDKRILGAVFTKGEWTPAGRVASTTPGHEAFGVERQTIIAYVKRSD